MGPRANPSCIPRRECDDGQRRRRRPVEPRILIIEDDAAILELIRFHLEGEGFRVVQATDGRSGLAQFEKVRPDLILLDLMLPEIDGMEVCRRIRKTSNVPIIMLTAKGQEDDRVHGLQIGADDYVTKPFSPKELVARIRAVLRRSNVLEGPSSLRAGKLYIDRKRHRVLIGDREIELTPKEFDLLTLLMTRRGEPVDRDTLLEEVWGYEFAGGTRTLDVHIRRLRQKLGDDPQQSKYIETVHGIGYRFKDDVEIGNDEEFDSRKEGESRV